MTIIEMSWKNNDVNVFGLYNKIESGHIYKKLDFFKLNFWMNNKISTNSLEGKNNFVKIKINN